MTKKEFSEAWEIAQSEREFSSLEYNEALRLFDGCGLMGFEPVNVTIEAVAVLIRYQCQYLNGGWDLSELSDIASIARKKFLTI